jgi:hypothetical protein
VAKADSASSEGCADASGEADSGTAGEVGDPGTDPATAAVANAAAAVAAADAAAAAAASAAVGVEPAGSARRNESLGECAGNTDIVNGATPVSDAVPALPPKVAGATVGLLGGKDTGAGGNGLPPGACPPLRCDDDVLPAVLL